MEAAKGRQTKIRLMIKLIFFTGENLMTEALCLQRDLSSP